MNRQVLNGGVNNGYDLSTNNINAAQGHILTYDKNGNRTSDTRYGTQVTEQFYTSYDESSNPVVMSTSRNPMI